MTGKETRKLAAVMFADISGYTAMVQENEAVALAKVDVHRNTLKHFTSTYKGDIIAFYGDGSLSTYPSAVDAVTCALKMQEEYSKRDVPVRIGLHLGDIIFKEGNVFGEGVDLASEIESEGIPGAILISSKLHAEIANHPQIKSKSLGYYALKHANAPIELFAITNHGLTVPAGKKQQGKSWRLISRIGIAFLLIALISYFLFDMGIFNTDETLKQETIAVRFMDLANINGKERLADMASLWITNRIQDIPGSKVVKHDNSSFPPELVMATAGSSTRHKFAKQTGATNLLEGQIFLEGDSLIFDAQIINLENGNIKQRFGPIKSSALNEMQGINEITEEIRGWWASKDLKFLSVPNYKAYNAYLLARSVWLEDKDLAENKLKEATVSDPDFIDPYFLLLGLLQNQDRFAERDTLLVQIKEHFKDMNGRQRNLLEAATLQAEGDLTESYLKNVEEAKHDSLDLFVNTEIMVFAMSFVNKPEDAIHYFRMIPTDSLDLGNCGYCTTRLRVAAAAYLALDNIERAVQIVDLIDESTYKNIERKIEIHVAAQNSESVSQLINSAIKNEIPNASGLWTYVAWQFKLRGDKEGMADALENALAPNIKSEYSKAEANYLLGDYEKANKDVDNWIKRYPENQYILSRSSRFRARLGNEAEIEAIIKLLDLADEKDAYDYGFYTYYKGVIAAIQGDQEKALDLLEEAYSQGHQFFGINYDHDVDLMPLFDHPRFIKLMHPTVK